MTWTNCYSWPDNAPHHPWSGLQYLQIETPITMNALETPQWNLRKSRKSLENLRKNEKKKTYKTRRKNKKNGGKKPEKTRKLLIFQKALSPTCWPWGELSQAQAQIAMGILEVTGVCWAKTTQLMLEKGKLRKKRAPKTTLTRICWNLKKKTSSKTPFRDVMIPKRCFRRAQNDQKSPVRKPRCI